METEANIQLIHSNQVNYFTSIPILTMWLDLETCMFPQYVDSMQGTSDSQTNLLKHHIKVPPFIKIH